MAEAKTIRKREVRNDELRLRLSGRKDVNNDDYYYALPDLPVLVDLQDVVFMVFPDEEDDGRFGADLVIRRREVKDGRKRP